MTKTRGRKVDIDRLVESLELMIYSLRASDPSTMSPDALLHARCLWAMIDSTSPDELVVAGDFKRSIFIRLLWDEMLWLELEDCRPDVDRLSQLYGLLAADGEESGTVSEKDCDTPKKKRSNTYYPKTEHGQLLIERWKKLPRSDRERINKSQLCRDFLAELNPERAAEGLEPIELEAMRQVLNRFLKGQVTT